MATVILKPIFTEKSVNQAKEKCYHFEVAKTANKNMVALAIEKQFNVKVLTINIVNKRNEVKKVWRKGGMKVLNIPGYKKALVTLKDGRIDIFDETKK